LASKNSLAKGSGEKRAAFILLNTKFKQCRNRMNPQVQPFTRSHHFEEPKFRLQQNSSKSRKRKTRTSKLLI
jgi:hypothetical protein